jgi:WD40 repeat protein
MWVQLLAGEEGDWSARRSNLEGHTDSVTSISFSQDRQFLASASSDKSIRIWYISTGTCRSTLVGHTEEVTSVGFSYDGSLLASTSYDETIRLWDTRTWSHKTTLIGHTEVVRTLAWSRNDLFIATSSDDKTVKLWDIQNELLYATYERGGTYINLDAVAISPDNRLVAAVSCDTTIRIWDTSTMLGCGLIDGDLSIHAIQFSPDSQSIAVIVNSKSDQKIGNEDSNVRLYDVETGRMCSSFNTGPTSRFVTFVSDSENVAFWKRNVISLWNYRTGVCQTKLEGCTDPGDCCAISPDKTAIATHYIHGTIRIWDLATVLVGNITHVENDVSSLIDYYGCIFAITRSPDGKLFASRHTYEIRVWDSTTSTCIHTLGYVLPPYNVDTRKPFVLEFSPNNMILAYTSQLGEKDEVRLLDTQTWSDCTVFDRTYSLQKILFSENGELLVSESSDEVVHLWDLVHGSCMSMFESRHHELTTFCLSRNNKLVALGYEDGIVALWDVATESTKTLAGHTDYITSLTFSQDARLLASGSCDTTTRLWDVVSNTCRSVLGDRHERVKDVAISPDDKLVASLCFGGAIRLWDTENGRFRHTYQDLLSSTRNVAFSSCGTYLQTDRGSLLIPLSVLDRPLSEIQRPPSIFVDYRWIYLNGTPLLWLPVEYRPKKMHISGSTIFIVTRAAKFKLLRLDLDELKRIEPRYFEPSMTRTEIVE